MGPEGPVGILLRRTPRLIASILAVAAAGGTYVPLDPVYPAERLAYILADSGVAVVLSEEELAPLLPACAAKVLLLDRATLPGRPALPKTVEPGWRQVVAEDPERLAYLIYTSGSTGRPKGVGVRQGGVLELVAWAESVYSPDLLSGVLAATSICFDVSAYEIWVTLCLGGRLILVDDVLNLPGLAPSGEVKVVCAVPSAMGELMRLDGVPPSVRVVNLAGEPLRRELAERIAKQPGIEAVYNLYGPTEDTTYSTLSRVSRLVRGPSIRRPIAGSRVYVLDHRLRPAPIGAPGELWLGGRSLARGYVARPELTAERFLPDRSPPRGQPALPDGDLPVSGPTASWNTWAAWTTRRRYADMGGARRDRGRRS